MLTAALPGLTGLIAVLAGIKSTAEQDSSANVQSSSVGKNHNETPWLQDILGCPA